MQDKLNWLPFLIEPDNPRNIFKKHGQIYLLLSDYSHPLPPQSVSTTECLKRQLTAQRSHRDCPKWTNTFVKRSWTLTSPLRTRSGGSPSCSSDRQSRWRTSPTMACSDQSLSRQRLLPPVVCRIVRGLDMGGWGMFVTVSVGDVFIWHITFVTVWNVNTSTPPSLPSLWLEQPSPSSAPSWSIGWQTALPTRKFSHKLSTLVWGIWAGMSVFISFSVELVWRHGFFCGACICVSQSGD